MFERLAPSRRRCVWLAVLVGAPAVWLPTGFPQARALELPSRAAQVMQSGDDPVLQELIAQAVKLRPELARAGALVAAERERLPQAGSLPDPSLSFGIQNEGFRGISVGQTEASWLSVSATQTLPWFGKRRMRVEVAEEQVRQAEADEIRAHLDVEAEVRSAYIDLLAVRDRRQLLNRLDLLWEQAEASARSRYEAGDGAQSDLLRVQLERSRLRQRRWLLDAGERRALAALNSLRGHALDEPIVTTRSVTEIPDPVLPDIEELVAESQAGSPELRRARAAVSEAAGRVALARREHYPDVTVSAGLMPRWGGFETMWQAAVGVSLPLWRERKQSRAVAENGARRAAAEKQVEAVNRLLRQRISERVALIAALVDSNRLFRSGVLVQSDATVASALAQYRVGRVPFAAVLEALAGYLNDVEAFIGSAVTSQQLAIALDAISLESGGAIAVAGVGSAKAPPSGGAPATAGASASGGGPSTGAAAPSSGSGMSSM